MWLSRLPTRGFRQNEDDGDSDGGGGGGRGPDDGRPGPGPGGDDIDWDAFEREFEDYVDSRLVEPAAK
jgi:hypothetical protein